VEVVVGVDILNQHIKNPIINSKQLNSRQLKVLGKIFDKGAEKFVGGINTKKYMTIAKTNRAT
jgi:hypothetical protein